MPEFESHTNASGFCIVREDFDPKIAGQEVLETETEIRKDKGLEALSLGEVKRELKELRIAKGEGY